MYMTRKLDSQPEGRHTRPSGQRDWGDQPHVQQGHPMPRLGPQAEWRGGGSCAGRSGPAFEAWGAAERQKGTQTSGDRPGALITHPPGTAGSTGQR